MEKTLKDTGISIEELTTETAGEATAQAGMGIITVLAVMVGLWGAACLIGGLAAAGGPMTLLRSWLTAVTGM